MEYLQTFNDQTNRFLTPLDNPYINAGLRLFLVLYAGKIAPTLSTNMLQYLNWTPVRIAVLFLVCYLSFTSAHDPALALLVAIAFFVTFNTLSGRQVKERFEAQGQQYE